MFCKISILLFIFIYQVEYCAFHALRLFIYLFFQGIFISSSGDQPQATAGNGMHTLCSTLSVFNLHELFIGLSSFNFGVHFLCLFRPKLAWIACFVMRRSSNLWLVFMLMYLHNIVGSGKSVRSWVGWAGLHKRVKMDLVAAVWFVLLHLWKGCHILAGSSLTTS